MNAQIVKFRDRQDLCGYGHLKLLDWRHRSSVLDVSSVAIRHTSALWDFPEPLDPVCFR